MENYLLPGGFILREKYSIKKVLGQGGFGITYLAEDMVLDIDVCIKELFISGNSTRGQNMNVLTYNLKDFSFADFKERFLLEAKQLAKFSHMNIVRVIDFFEANNTAYVVMEYLKGQTLKELVASKGALDFEESKAIINQLLNAVEVVHNAGMLHRDIKPDNIILTNDGRVVLIDFGSARAFTEGKTVAQTAMVSPGYAPLEQYNPNARKGSFTDIYSIGATFYFMLTGEKPLNATERYSEHLKAPHELNHSVSMQVSSAVMLAMEMKPEDRFQHVNDFREALEILKDKQPKIKDKKDKLSDDILNKNNINKSKNRNKLNIILYVSLFGFLINITYIAIDFIFGNLSKDFIIFSSLILPSLLTLYGIINMLKYKKAGYYVFGYYFYIISALITIPTSIFSYYYYSSYSYGLFDDFMFLIRIESILLYPILYLNLYFGIFPYVILSPLFILIKLSFLKYYHSQKKNFL
jgi:serine/threonine protein kinase